MAEPEVDTAANSIEMLRQRYQRRYNNSARSTEQVWESRYSDMHVFGREKIAAQLDLMHQEPVKAGLVDNGHGLGVEQRPLVCRFAGGRGDGGTRGRKIYRRDICSGGGPGREQRGGEGREGVDGIVVEPAAAFEGGSEEAVEEEANDCSRESDGGFDGGEPEYECGDGGDDGCACGSGERAVEADGSVGSGGNATECGEHVRIAAEDFAEFG